MIHDLPVYTGGAFRPVCMSLIYVAPQGQTTLLGEVHQPNVSPRSRTEIAKGAHQHDPSGCLL